MPSQLRDHRKSSFKQIIDRLNQNRKLKHLYIISKLVETDVSKQILQSKIGKQTNGINLTVSSKMICNKFSTNEIDLANELRNKLLTLFSILDIDADDDDNNSGSVASSSSSSSSSLSSSDSGSSFQRIENTFGFQLASPSCDFIDEKLTIRQHLEHMFRPLPKVEQPQTMPNEISTFSSEKSLIEKGENNRDAAITLLEAIATACRLIAAFRKIAIELRLQFLARFPQSQHHLKPFVIFLCDLIRAESSKHRSIATNLNAQGTLWPPLIELICLHCKSHDHLKSQCPLLLRKLFCFRCFRRGHLAHHCFDLPLFAFTVY